MSVANPLQQLLGRAGEARGRVVTTLAPEGYVVVDGLLLRATATAGHARIGAEVLLRARGDDAVLAARGLDTGALGDGAPGDGDPGDGDPGAAP